MAPLLAELTALTTERHRLAHLVEPLQRQIRVLRPLLGSLAPFAGADAAQSAAVRAHAEAILAGVGLPPPVPATWPRGCRHCRPTSKPPSRPGDRICSGWDADIEERLG